MQLGIFAKTFDRPNVTSCLQAVADASIPATQFNLSVAGLPTIPDEPVPDDVVNAIRAATDQAGVALAAISGTFNATHPDPAHRQTYLTRFSAPVQSSRPADRHHHPQQRVSRSAGLPEVSRVPVLSRRERLRP
jgi:hypothetical protein